MNKARAFALGDATQASLPFDFGALALFLHFVNVVCLIVEHHQFWQPGEEFQHVAARIAAVKYIETVTRRATRREWQHLADHALRWQCCSGRCERFLVYCFVYFGKQVPVGNRDHAVACRLEADIVLVAHVTAHKAEHLLAIRIGNEQFGKLRQIRSVKIAAARHAAICTAHQLAAERVE